MSQGELQLNLVDAWLYFEFFTLKRAKDKSPSAGRERGVRVREPALARNQFWRPK